MPINIIFYYLFTFCIFIEDTTSCPLFAWIEFNT